MSLEQALAANTEAINRLAALMQGANITHNPAAPVIPVPVQQPAPQSFAPPAPPAPPAAPPAMPAAPFPGPQAPAAPAGLPPRPFNDAVGLLAWAEAKYKQVAATNPGVVDQLTNIIRAHGLDQVGIGAAQPSQFDSLYQAISALG